MEIRKLAPLSGSLRSWFEAQVERDGRGRGDVTWRGQVAAKDGALTVARSFRSARGIQTFAYVGYPVGSQARFIVTSGASPQSLALALNELNDLGAKLGAMDAGAGKSSNSAQKKTPQVRSQSKTATRGTGGKLAPVAAKGTLKSSQMLGVYLAESYTGGVGGMMVLQFDPVLLLRDGSARRDLEIPPLDLNVARDKAANPKDWGRWTRSGDKFVVRWSPKDKDEIRASYKTKPARPGQTITRAYESLSGGGNTAMGGDVMVYASGRYAFARDGSFSTQKSGGGMSSSITATSSRSRGGRYRLDGHALTLRYNDGRTVRKMFYFFPDGDRAIGIGDSTYTIDD
jgi:hypothetical protein